MKRSVCAALLAVCALIAAVGCTHRANKGDTGTDTNEKNEMKDTNVTSDGDIAQAVKPTPMLVVEANGRVFYANIEKNECADALVEALNPAPLTLALSDGEGDRKEGKIPFDLPASDAEIKTGPGDIVICGDTLAVCFANSECTGTLVASIGAQSEDELREALGEGEGEITLSLEWSE